MAHITSIGAGLYSDLSVAMGTSVLSASALAALDTFSEFQTLFTTGIDTIGGTKTANTTFVRIQNVREFPAMGTPANIVNVPVYGSKTSRQIQGQSDAPSLELTLNYVAADWADDGSSLLGSAVGDGNIYVFRFTLLNTEPTGSTTNTRYGSPNGPTGLGTVQNSQYFWYGKIEALLVTPQLTDATTATLTLSMQSEFYGAYTSAPTV
jgi:hypothetical protein